MFLKKIVVNFKLFENKHACLLQKVKLFRMIFSRLRFVNLIKTEESTKFKINLQNLAQIYRYLLKKNNHLQ